MVVRVWGTADGKEILFERASGGLFQTVIPLNEKGECAVEIYAQDDAGNVSYAATMLFTASGHEMRCYLVPRGFSGNAEDIGYAAQVDPYAVFAGILQGSHAVEVVPEQKYTTELQEGGYTVECKLCREP